MRDKKPECCQERTAEVEGGAEPSRLVPGHRGPENPQDQGQYEKWNADNRNDPFDFHVHYLINSSIHNRTVSTNIISHLGEWLIVASFDLNGYAASLLRSP